MFKFFRRVRLALLSESKFSKYLLYALGEILLVVIGILIALQINNWNETRKMRAIEREILHQFVVELTGDVKTLEQKISNGREHILSSTILIYHLDNKLAYHDSLNHHFDQWLGLDPLSFNTSAFNNLESRGLEIISNNELRNQILHLYTKKYPEALRVDEYFTSDYHNFLAEINLRYLRNTEWGVEAIPFDYPELIQSNEFVSALEWSKNANETNLEWYISTLYTLKVLRNAINIELKLRN
ncbi:MAG: hypothetical protein JXR11_08945 [Balneola sp.]